MKIRYRKITYQEVVELFGKEHQKVEVQTSISKYCYLWDITLDSRKYELRWLATNVLNIYCEAKDISFFTENHPTLQERLFILWNEKTQKFENY